MPRKNSYHHPKDAPEADHIQGFKCEHCANLHIALMDENDRYIAIGNLSRDMLVDMLKMIDQPVGMTRQ